MEGKGGGSQPHYCCESERHFNDKSLLLGELKCDTCSTCEPTFKFPLVLLELQFKGVGAGGKEK